MVQHLVKTQESGLPAPARLFALIPCAGQGSRAVHTAGDNAGLAKQYQQVGGQPVLAHTLGAFRALGPLMAGVYVVISPADQDFERLFPPPLANGVQLLRCGGATRADSVLAGLQAMLAQGGVERTDWVLVHDAARCLVTPEQIGRLIEACRHDAVGGLLAHRLADTLKSEDAGRVAATLERSGKWLAQTPQMFRVGALIDALVHAHSRGLVVTDESSAIEAQGLSPRLVPASAQNFKITYPEDFSLAEAILRSRQG
jgi:2-C-methyl-D-erythritol 4-phosphate cytidylyltransferase